MAATQTTATPKLSDFLASSPTKIKYRYLGNTGLLVSEICLGAMTFGDSGPWKIPTAESDEVSFQIMNKFVEAGGNFIDTANVYGNGNSEETVGKWLTTKKRDDVVIATKVRLPMGTGPNSCGLSRKHIMSQVDESLKRLQTNYIDLYQVHAWDSGTPLKETLSTLSDLVRSGKVRYIGASNYTAGQLQRAVDIGKYCGLEMYCSLQAQYSLLCRSPEWELFPVCQDEGLAYLPWSPLKGGWLTGKYNRDTKPDQGRVAWSEAVGWSETNWSALANDKTWNLLDKVKEVANETGKTMSQISLRWVMQRPGVTSTIIGARTLSQLEDNIGAGTFELTEAQMQILNEASQIEVPYPYNRIPALNLTRARHLH
eukprot:TRINITY_DN959_c0_g1_i2.p1 TRINITY_DN959_c0_g1~~TRINITY_DN959_c0_g1_i2.p1  ORF type:complete len:370 (-),score=179.03 TRINITY_DN959_c0_g1_i2:115-1224(-)